MSDPEELLLSSFISFIHQWAVQFLRLEKLYHERLLSNLTTLQEKWEREFNEKEDGETRGPPEEDSVSRKHIEKLSHICRTHHRPSFSLDQKNLNAALIDTRIGTETLQPHHGKANKPENTQSMMSQSDFSSPQREEEEERQDEEEALKKGQEVEAEEQEVEPEEQEVEPEEHAAHGEDTPEEEEVKVEWPAGVAQASDKDLAKLSIAEGSSSPDGLVSILKRRRASLDGLPPLSPATTADKQTSKRKVRFSEPEDGVDQDDIGGDSCLILLLLCLITVVISIGGTAFYCTLVDTYSNICTDFTQNVDFYVTNARGFLEGLGLWLPLQT
ncbi:consortin, connexin sorting protein b isoform X3 [Gambusia affinis]|uniref:consortin, connexin sorting protein b isoform X3 n=1 Tax=Gambusia affinis TaxID=33528 RepID=UPI001CDD2E13|nr:consortin, connexin sorting protein b isoform X3 [Gambusia affinis]XP_043962699.1 consortin, connexin sorting protein b isoform X3 [Gambusia affinis]